MDLKHITSNLRLKEVQQSFIDDVRPKYIMPTLRKLGVFTDDEEQKLKASLNREDEVKTIIDFMLIKDAKQMNNFIKALREDENGDSPYPWLADALERKKELSGETHKTLVNGNIPFPINHFLERFCKNEGCTVSDKIRNHLKNASFEDRWWVTLHGPFGSGKTVFAAQAVRDNEIIEKVFPGGIYWIYFGYFQGNQSADFEEEKIKEQMKTLFVWMQSDVELYPDETIQNLKFCLRKAVVNRGKTLIVLDSVGSSTVINAFDIGCTVLVTTTCKAVMNPVPSRVTWVRMEDLDDGERLSLISKYIEVPPANKDMAEKLAKKCGGSPLMITLLSLYLEDIGTNLKLWNEFYLKLEKTGTDTVRRRHRSGSGDYHHDLETLVRFSLDSIKDKVDKFYDFLVFAKDIPVPSEVLQKLWGIGELDVMLIMNDLHHRCFVEKVKTEESEFPAYIAHYLDILKNDKNENWLKERHKALIEKLNISPTGDLDLTLFSKSYIPLALCYHLSKAGEERLLENVCLNLHYVEKKIHITGNPELLYMDYHLNMDTFEHPEHVQQFEAFVRKNASSICKKVDIFQLALFEPESSIVYQKARNHVSSLNSGHYYNWCNKKDSDLYYKCKIWDAADEKEITHAAINSDGSLVAVAMDTHGEIYQSATGEQLMKLLGHRDKVTHCAFNSKGDEVCTASEDTTVKIFKIDESMITSDSFAKRRMSMEVLDKHNESFTFDRHSTIVLCCEFSSDDQNLISCDKLGTVLVWQITTSGTSSVNLRKLKWDRPLDIRSCFSWNGNLFGSYSFNTVKVWQTDAPEREDTPLMNQIFEFPITGFCFSGDDKSAFVALSDDILKCKYNGPMRSVLKPQRSKDYTITCCCTSPDGNFLAYGTSSHSVIIVNVHSLNEVAYFQGHNMPVDHVKFSRDGKRLLSVSGNRHMIHNLSNLKDEPIANFAKNLSVRLDREGCLLIASSNYFNRIEVRKGYDGTLIATTKNDEDSDITACSISYDCKEVVYGNKKGCVKVFNLDDKSVGCFQNHENRITFILHSKANPPCFFTCSEDKTIKVWKKERNDPLTLKGHRDSVLMCAEFKKGDKLLSCSKDGTMKVWNTETGEILVRMDEGHGNADVRFCDISLPNEELLASASSDETVKVWKSVNGDLKRVFRERDCDAAVKCCRFLNKLQVLVSGHDNGKIKVWSMDERDPIFVLEKHDSAVHNILCHETSRRLLTLSNDIKLWDWDKLLKNIVLPSSSMGYAPPNVWASRDFRDIVVILNSVLYILRRIH